MARLLNQGVLPPGYYAVPLLDRDGPIEIDVATLQGPAGPNGAHVPQPSSPRAPALDVAVELPAADEVEVQIFADDGDPRLAAAVELVSRATRIGPGPVRPSP